MSLTGLCFGTGTTSASFQEGGRRDSWKEELRIAETGPARRSAFPFNNHAGIPSGPCALERSEGRKERLHVFLTSTDPSTSEVFVDVWFSLDKSINK